MSSMRKTGIVVAAVGAIVVPWSVQAHHSAIRFDLSVRDHYVEGIVKEFAVANPHTKIVIEVTDEKGTRDVEFEGHSRNNYYRSGWREGLVKVGDKIKLQAAPTRDGSDGGYALGVIAADGTEF
jgi:uncharacterized protein DUF6152